MVLAGPLDICVPALTLLRFARKPAKKVAFSVSVKVFPDFEAEEPNGSYYEYDRNLKATVKVTPDGERTPVEKLETGFEPARGKAPRKIAREEITT